MQKNHTSQQYDYVIDIEDSESVGLQASPPPYDEIISAHGSCLVFRYDRRARALEPPAPYGSRTQCQRRDRPYCEADASLCD